MPLSPGTRVGRYEIDRAIGAGGMGEVYRALDPSLGRHVALKVLPPDLARDPDRIDRFRREAQTLAALDHPGIVTVHSIEEDDDAQVHFLTMQLVEGQSLDRAVPDGGLPAARVLAIGAGLADALAAAHDRGIVHRDLKPSNVMLTPDGRVKVLDFGIAKALTASDPADATRTSGAVTAAGQIIGTPAYMSPEQIEGHPVHASSDVFSLGIVLYEIASGRRPFEGASTAAVMSSILRDTAPALTSAGSNWPSGVRARLDALIARCLHRNSAQRPSAREVAEELRRLGGLLDTPAPRRMGRVLAIAAVVLAVVGIAGYALARKALTASWQRLYVAESLPRIEALARNGKFLEAFQLARDIEEREGARVVSEAVWDLTSTRVSVVSEPAGATVTLRPFGYAGSAVELGAAPLDKVRVPRGALAWRVQRPGYLPHDYVTSTPPDALRFDLRPENSPDADMVRVPAGPIRLWAIGSVKPHENVSLGAYLIDRREVTNSQFAAFVQAGGYRRREWWTHIFKDGGRVLSFDEAMARFKDATGRPGPATWRLGSYPDGEEDLPVNGLSWYEAAAYATFAGKELPSVYHWYLADTANDLQLLPGLVLSTTNHDGKGPRRSTAATPISAYGAQDLAGNVREWTVNESDGGTRLTLGGMWSDPAYLYLFPDARSTFDRSAGNGLRTIKRLDASAGGVENTPLPARIALDGRTRRPVGDSEYAVFTRFYERTPLPLDAKIDATDDSSPHWTRQRVSFAAGYGGERTQALLYLPKNARPPFQTVVFMGGAATFYRKSSATEREIFGWAFAEYLVRGGRAVMIPIWKGSYERSDGFHPLQTEWPSYREHVTQWVSELRQSVDYLQSRSDMAGDKVAYEGVSNGAVWAPLFMALEPRIKTSLLILGGLLNIQLHATPMPPEIDPLHFAPRVRNPVLMMNGRHDAIFTYETSQVPLYRLLGSPPADKKHLVYPGGHSSFGWTNEMIREALDWLDQRLGPVAK